jgi:hypothetical protein
MPFRRNRFWLKRDQQALNGRQVRIFERLVDDGLVWAREVELRIAEDAGEATRSLFEGVVDVSGAANFRGRVREKDVERVGDEPTICLPR